MTSALPADRAGLIAELERLESDFLSLAAPLDRDRFDWRPDGGRTWSFGQIVDHLATTNSRYLDALEPALERARERSGGRSGPIEPGLLGRLFLGQLEPPVRYRVRAPGPFRPAPRVEREETLDRFRTQQARIAALVRASADLDPRRARFRNPAVKGLPVFDLAAGMLILPSHERRHLEQARRLLARPDFPR
ncbi:MAG TPA: DinB family protein [Thermoanaerobaculia bacterium]|nr:DinB family protein [Thermoanaerobaculia bacterium]